MLGIGVIPKSNIRDFLTVLHRFEMRDVLLLDVEANIPTLGDPVVAIVIKTNASHTAMDASSDKHHCVLLKAATSSAQVSRDIVTLRHALEDILIENGDLPVRIFNSNGDLVICDMDYRPGKSPDCVMLKP